MTKFGNLQSECSANGFTKRYYNENYEEIVTLSFSEDILLWLDKCLKNSNTVKIDPIREILLQFISTIRDFTNKIEDDLYYKISLDLLNWAKEFKLSLIFAIL